MKQKGRDPFSHIQQALFGLLAHNLFGRELNMLPDTDWAEVFRESHLQGVALTAFYNCGRLDIPQETVNEAKSLMRQYLFRDARVAAQHTAVHTVMTKAGIPYTILKGMASAAYYPTSGIRSMGDVDFYVRKEDLEAARSALRADGYREWDMEHDCHIVLEKNGVRLELHYEVAGMPEGGVRTLMEEYVSDLTQTAVLLKHEMATCLCPSPFHHGLIMLMHMQHHMLESGVGLRHLCDWAVFVQSFEGEAFQATYEDRLKRVGLWDFGRYLSLTSALYLGVTERAWMREDCHDDEVAAEIMADILAGGNFGVKDKQRKYEGMFISNNSEGGKSANRITEGFRSLNRITYIKCPFTKKYPFLLPVGWVIALLGFLGRNRQRKKRGKDVSAMNAYRKSAARRKLYGKLHIYETKENR